MNNQTELTQRKSSNTIIMYEYEWFDSFVLYSDTKLLEYMYGVCTIMYCTFGVYSTSKY